MVARRDLYGVAIGNTISCVHIPELSYELYSPRQHAGVAAFSVGWLGDEVPSTGEVTAETRALVEHLAFAHIANQYRGLHICEMCPAPGTYRSWNGMNMLKELPYPATGECWFDLDRRRFVFPAMINHYVTVHDYKPPPAVQAAAGVYWNSPAAKQCRDGLCHGNVIGKAGQGDLATLTAAREAAIPLDTIVDDQGFGVFYHAADNRQAPILQWFADHYEVTTEMADRAFYRATRPDHGQSIDPDLCTLVVALGADIDQVSNRGTGTALYQAARRGDEAGFRVLLDLGAALDRADPDMRPGQVLDSPRALATAAGWEITRPA